MKYKGKMKFVFTVDVSAETDDNISEMKFKQTIKKEILDGLKCYVGNSSSAIGIHRLYECTISSVKELKK